MTTELVANNDPDYANRLIDEQEAANFLGYSVRALQNWRLRGGGPEYVRVSKRSVRYRRRDLIRWADERLEPHTSASPAPNVLEADEIVDDAPKEAAAIEQQKGLTRAHEPPHGPKPADSPSQPTRIKRPHERLFVRRTS